METTIEIFGVASFVIIVMHTFQPYAWIVSKIKNIKPFSCELCMCLWTYFIYHISMYGFSTETVLESFICAVVGYLLSIKFIKW